MPCSCGHFARFVIGGRGVGGGGVNPYIYIFSVQLNGLNGIEHEIDGRISSYCF